MKVLLTGYRRPSFIVNKRPIAIPRSQRTMYTVGFIGCTTDRRGFHPWGSSHLVYGVTGILNRDPHYTVVNTTWYSRCVWLNLCSNFRLYIPVLMVLHTLVTLSRTSNRWFCLFPLHWTIPTLSLHVKRFFSRSSIIFLFGQRTGS